MLRLPMGVWRRVALISEDLTDRGVNRGSFLSTRRLPHVEANVMETMFLIFFP